MEITPEIITTFRTDFDGFSDDTRWTEAKVRRALQKADKETGGSRWGKYSDLSIKQEGLFNYAAHQLTVKNANAKASAVGATPSSIAPVASRSVADESVSYAVESVKSDQAALNATSYGQEFVRLRGRVAAGGANCMQGGIHA